MDSMRDKVESALGRVRPFLQDDGGDVQLIDVKEGVVTVRLTGACGGCPMAAMTLQAGVERVVKEMVPEVKKVVAVEGQAEPQPSSAAGGENASL